MATSPDVHLSPHDRGGWADPIGNDTILPHPLFLQTAGYLMVAKFPLPLLSPFLHEATHHWCFESYLGYAVSALWLRARRRAYVLAQQDDPSDEDRGDFLDDITRYWSIVLMLRPLAEGMALFAEHDVYTNPDLPDELLPPFYSWLLVAAGDWDGKRPFSEVESTFLERLRNTRLAKQGIERKRNLLSQPLGEKSGYLAGYLTVKVLWSVLSMRSPQLFEKKGLFLSFLRSWIYDSILLMEQFFDPSVQGLDVAERVATAFQHRLSQLVHVTDDDITRFENENLRPALPQKPESRPKNLPVAVEELFRASENLEQPEMAWLDVQTINRRHLMRFFSAKVRVRVNEYRRVLVFPMEPVEGLPPDVPILSFGALPDAQEGEGDGLIEYHVSFSRMYHALLIFREGKIVGSTVQDEHAEDLAEYQIAGGVDHFRALRDASNELIDEVLEKHDLQLSLDVAIASIEDVTRRSYQRRGLPCETDEQEFEAAELMREEGFWELLGGNSERVAALAICSAATSALLPLEALQFLFDDLGCTFPADLDATRARLAELGLRYIVTTDDVTIGLT